MSILPPSRETTDRVASVDRTRLRDEFAGRALSGMLGNVEHVLDRRGMAAIYASFAYAVADAMLVEREK